MLKGEILIRVFTVLLQDETTGMSPAGRLDELERLQTHLSQMDLYGAWLFAHAKSAGAAATAGERKLVDALRVRLGISKAEAHKKRRTAKAASNPKIRKGYGGWRPQR